MEKPRDGGEERDSCQEGGLGPPQLTVMTSWSLAWVEELSSCPIVPFRFFYLAPVKILYFASRTLASCAQKGYKSVLTSKEIMQLNYVLNHCLTE